MKAQLCKCNVCDTVMVDKNPADQPELNIPVNVRDMVLVQEVDQSTGNMIENFWGCPVCLTDANLIDVYELAVTEAKVFDDIFNSIAAITRPGKAMLLGLVLMACTGCQVKTYHCVSINVDRPDTLNINANNKRIVRYSEPTKQGDTVQIWYSEKEASNYVVKSIK